MTDISPAIRGLQFMLDQYSGKRPYEGYPKALQDGIAIINTLSAALTQSKAEVAAAYERAADVADDYVAMRINQIETEKSKAAINIDVPQVMRWGAGKVQAEAIASAIRALATPDQTAALDKLIVEAEALAVEKTAAMVKTWRNTTPMTGEECANAIIAASKKGGV